MTSPTDKSYKIREVTIADRDAIVDYLRASFFKDEPLNSFLELITEDNPTCETLEEFTVGHIPTGINLVAVHNDQIVGLCLSGPMEKGEQLTFDCQNEKYNKLVRLLDYAEKQCDPFEIYPNSTKGISVQVISVRKDFTGRGIAAELLQKACDLAKQRGYDFVDMACTSLYSAKLSEKLNFELKYSLKYTDYKENGEVVFKPELPHTTLKIYLKKL
ncbi:arylalkylamine N-acetyltransferase 1-like [Diabrotica undecimpunctata]|uniref:arylalkylamine N-acetyltransferase 1-like n=1 Tax=Diabrotica undecimpunctata TaxID=50387 RepID=UPI003B638AA8